MRRHLVSTTVLMAAFASPPWASAATHSTTTVNDYSWSEDGQAFGLHSQTGGHGVVVTRVEPEPFHGLRRGDVLVAADGKPLHQVEELMRMLRGRTTPLALQVQRGQRLATLVWSHADYQRLRAPEAAGAATAARPAPAARATQLKAVPAMMAAARSAAAMAP